MEKIPNDNINYLLANRPSWDEYFMLEACVAASRSPDPRTKHGAIIVNNKKKPLGQGYNGFPSGGSNDVYPITSPEKYSYILHSEVNSILNCTFPPEGCTLYVTGMPCSKCMLQVVQSGIIKVIYGKIFSIMVDTQESDKTKFIAHNHGIILEEYNSVMSPRQWLLHIADYLLSKGWE